MPRAVSVITPNQRHASADDRSAADTAILDYAQRSLSRGAVTTVKGVAVDLDLPGTTRLRTDDLLALDDGTLVEVVAAPEPLIEARATGLARLAWHLGDRHIAVELLPNRIRVRRDAAAEALLTALGAKLTLIEAPFEAEGGAYDAPAHDAGHHGQHDHAHHDHAHHDHACGHDHSHDHHDHGHHDHAHHGHDHKSGHRHD